MATSLQRAILSVLFGLCIPLSLAPFHFWPLVFVGIGGFIALSVTATSTKQALFNGWLFGVGYFGLGVSWVFGSMQTVGTPLPLAVLLTGGFCLLLALCHAIQLVIFHRYLKFLPLAITLAAPLWWVINEWFREWFLTGMPWLYAGYALTDTPIAQLAAVVGIYGLSLLVALISGLLLHGLWMMTNAHTQRGARSVGIALTLLIGGLVFGWLKPASSWTTPMRPIQVAAIQSNIDQRLKWTAAQQTPTLEFFADSFSGLADADFILWPEAAMTLPPQRIPYFLGQIDDIGRKRDQAIVTGIVTEENGQYFNAMMAFGNAEGEYRKQHLVPFGEYLPFEKYLNGAMSFLNLSMSSMTPAPVPQQPIAFQLDNTDYATAAIICYEATYPGLVKRLAIASNLLSVVSNDAWFGDSIGPHQHLQITQLRAIENGRDLIRATQNGISALIDADGTLLKRSAQFEPAEVTGTLMLRTGRTPFQRLWVSAIPGLCNLLLAALMAVQLRNSTRRYALS